MIRLSSARLPSPKSRCWLSQVRVSPTSAASRGRPSSSASSMRLVGDASRASSKSVVPDHAPGRASPRIRARSGVGSGPTSSSASVGDHARVARRPRSRRSASARASSSRARDESRGVRRQPVEVRVDEGQRRLGPARSRTARRPSGPPARPRRAGRRAGRGPVVDLQRLGEVPRPPRRGHRCAIASSPASTLAYSAVGRSCEASACRARSAAPRAPRSSRTASAYAVCSRIRSPGSRSS